MAESARPIEQTGHMRLYARLHDHEDVSRVLIALRGLGFNERLSNRTDVDTLAGRYGSGAATYLSQPNQLTFEIRRSTEVSDDRDTR